MLDAGRRPGRFGVSFAAWGKGVYSYSCFVQTNAVVVSRETCRTKEMGSLKPTMMMMRYGGVGDDGDYGDGDGDDDDDDEMTTSTDLTSMTLAGIPHVAVEDDEAMDTQVLRARQRVLVPLREEEPRRNQEAQGTVWCGMARCGMVWNKGMV